MDLSFNLAPIYRDLKDPTSRQNFEDTPGQIPKLILTLRLKQSLDLGIGYLESTFDSGAVPYFGTFSIAKILN